MMKWSSNDTAGEVEALTDDPKAVAMMKDPPKLQQYGDEATKPTPGIVSES